MGILYFIKEAWLKEFITHFGIVAELYPQEYTEIWYWINEQILDWELNSKLENVCTFYAKLSGYSMYLRHNLEADGPKFTLYLEDKILLSFQQLPFDWQLPEFTKN